MSPEEYKKQLLVIGEQYEQPMRNIGINTHDFFVLYNKIDFYIKQLTLFIRNSHPSSSKMNQLIQQLLEELERWSKEKLSKDYLLEHLKEREQSLEEASGQVIKSVIQMHINLIHEHLSKL
jgi:uncharacterized protein (DUF1919 family)